MATLENINLDIDVQVENAVVTLDYDILWDSYDQASGQKYREAALLVGVEDGKVTALTGTTLKWKVVSAGTHSKEHRHIGPVTFGRSLLQEDPDDDTDEIKAEVRVKPIVAEGDSQLSNEVVLPR